MGERWTYSQTTQDGTFNIMLNVRVKFAIHVPSASEQDVVSDYVSWLNDTMTAADAALGRQVREAAAAAGVEPGRVAEVLCAAILENEIYQALVGYKCAFTTIEGDGGAMPLLDLLSPGSESIDVGDQECGELAVVIADAILSRLAPAPAPAEGEGRGS